MPLNQQLMRSQVMRVIPNRECTCSEGSGSARRTRKHTWRPLMSKHRQVLHAAAARVLVAAVEHLKCMCPTVRPPHAPAAARFCSEPSKQLQSIELMRRSKRARGTTYITTEAACLSLPLAQLVKVFTRSTIRLVLRQHQLVVPLTIVGQPTPRCLRRALYGRQHAPNLSVRGAEIRRSRTKGFTI